MTWHPDCGAPVELVSGELFDPDGAEHLCRDYVAWHQPADPRHPDDLPWPVVDAVVVRDAAVALRPAA